MARILTAVAPDTIERVRRILKGHELIFPDSLAQAVAALDKGGVQLIFIGARFDESRMFDFLEHIRQDARHRRIPIVTAIVVPTAMSNVTVSGLAHTTKIFGASVFVNFNDFADDDTENARLRIIVDALLLPAEVVPRVAEKLSRPGP